MKLQRNADYYAHSTHKTLDKFASAALFQKYTDKSGKEALIKNIAFNALRYLSTVLVVPMALAALHKYKVNQSPKWDEMGVWEEVMKPKSIIIEEPNLFQQMNDPNTPNLKEVFRKFEQEFDNLKPEDKVDFLERQQEILKDPECSPELREHILKRVMEPLRYDEGVKAWFNALKADENLRPIILEIQGLRVQNEEPKQD
jgi:multimeric flavodoxin WrbA